jgi:hypothetical protein
MADKQALYFGYVSGGHFLRGKDGWRDCGGHPGDYAPGFPWESAAWLDGSLLKNMKVPDWPDGRVHVVGGGRDVFWFAFVWWDRSGDKRAASNSGFYVRGFGAPVRETYNAIARIAFEWACKEWPDVVARQFFPLTIVDPIEDPR